MPNPLATAFKGKGLTIFARARTITSRYGLTPSKIDRALSHLADTLDVSACKATLPTTAVALARNPDVARKCQTRGLELAMHGLVHVDHTLLTLDEQRAHFRRARQIFEGAGVRVTGFRCPYLRWNADTLTALGECGFDYDSSQALAWDVVGSLETESYRRAVAFYRSQLANDYPALPTLANGLVRIPYCVPDDESLVERLRLPGPAMSQVWLTMLERTHAAGELFTVGLHPERTALCQEALHATLARARSLSPTVWIARLDEIATWWRTLWQAAFEVELESPEAFHLKITAPSRAAILVRSIEVTAPTQPWAHGYQRVLAREFTCRSNTRPWIGLSPDSPPALGDFIRQQGFLVEVSASSDFSFYLQRASFNAQDERPLLAELDQGSWPVVRLARWPDGAQSALCVTGDVDALTLWDYGLRAFGR